MISKEEIVRSLQPLNGGYFSIPDLDGYAAKVIANGRALVIRDGADLLAYVLYYDNQPTRFITMVWTLPAHRGSGLASTLVRQLIRADLGRRVALHVHKDNPARKVYERLNFSVVEQDGDILHMHC